MFTGASYSLLAPFGLHLQGVPSVVSYGAEGRPGDKPTMGAGSSLPRVLWPISLRGERGPEIVGLRSWFLCGALTLSGTLCSTLTLLKAVPGKGSGVSQFVDAAVQLAHSCAVYVQGRRLELPGSCYIPGRRGVGSGRALHIVVCCNRVRGP